MADVLVVGSKVKEAVKGNDLNMAGDFVEGLSKEVGSIVNKAAERCKANGRKTLRACDL